MREVLPYRVRAAKIHEPLHPDPTPDEIAQICAEIQSEWSEEDRLRRRGMRISEGEPLAYEIPQGVRVGI